VPPGMRTATCTTSSWPAAGSAGSACHCTNTILRCTTTECRHRAGKGAPKPCMSLGIDKVKTCGKFGLILEETQGNSLTYAARAWYTYGAHTIGHVSGQVLCAADAKTQAMWGKTVPTCCFLCKVCFRLASLASAAACCSATCRAAVSSPSLFSRSTRSVAILLSLSACTPTKTV